MNDIRSKIANNARRLLKDAELLHVAERYKSATAIAVIAIEEVGKIIHYVLWEDANRDGKEWHKKKQRNVGLLLSAQVFSRAIGKNVDLPKSLDQTQINIDDELSDILFPKGERPDDSGKKLGQLLFFKSGGAVNADEVRKLPDYEAMLIEGALHKLKNDCLYIDGTENKLDVDAKISEDVIYIAKAAVEMCRLL